MPGMEHVPAALARRRFLGPARRGSAPVDGVEITVHAHPLEEIPCDLALGLRDLKILRNQARDRLTGIIALVEQALGRIQIARTLKDLASLFRVERRARRKEGGQRL